MVTEQKKLVLPISRFMQLHVSVKSANIPKEVQVTSIYNLIILRQWQLVAVITEKKKNDQSPLSTSHG